MKIRLCAGIGVALGLAACSLHFEQRNETFPPRRGYNAAFFHRHKEAYRFQGAVHIAHARQHDILLFSGARHQSTTDRETDAYYRAWVDDPPRLGPSMMEYGPHTGQAMWRLYRAIDWTHEHHDQTYDILADDDLDWSDKAAVTRRVVGTYLRRNEMARSVAPLELTMRRAGVMMKPYFTRFRNEYPLSNDFFYVAHWWHPVIYEAMMIAGNDGEQEAAIDAVQRLIPQALEHRPQRMLLSREVMPRYSRLSPESANIFDNLHMLHGFVYDILAYEGWSVEEKRKEVYRVTEAMAYQPGDERFARRFDLPHPDVDPRRYEPWMIMETGGAMTRMMVKMFEGMWPMMSPDGSKQVPPAVMDQVQKKLRPGMEAGENPGSLHDAVMKLVPNMKMKPGTKEPGTSDADMVRMMVDHWIHESEGTPELPALPMSGEPSLAHFGSTAISAGGAK